MTRSFFTMSSKNELPPSVEDAVHTVLKTNYHPEHKHDSGKSEILVGMGCFWGAERLFWNKMPREDIYSTSVGYSGGPDNENTNYKSVCSGRTGHTEVVRIVYENTALNNLLKLFWENHDPTQGNRQGNDIGTQYRSAIYCSSEDQLKAAIDSRDLFQKEMGARGIDNKITTEIGMIKNYYLAETYHQQYLDKNPMGYCGLRGSGVACPLPLKKNNKN